MNTGDQWHDCQPKIKILFLRQKDSALNRI